MSTEDDASKRQLTIKEGYAAANEYFAKVGEIIRQLAFAGIALVWIFKTDIGGRQVVPNELFLPSLLLVAGLALDLMQYVVSGEIWYRITRSKERAKLTQFSVDAWVNSFGTALYWAKVISILGAYAVLSFFIVRHLFN